MQNIVPPKIEFEDPKKAKEQLRKAQPYMTAGLVFFILGLVIFIVSKFVLPPDSDSFLSIGEWVSIGFSITGLGSFGRAMMIGPRTKNMPKNVIH